MRTKAMQPEFIAEKIRGGIIVRRPDDEIWSMYRSDTPGYHYWRDQAEKQAKARGAGAAA